MGYINNIGQILESQDGKLRIEFNGAAMKDFIKELEKFGKANYSGKSAEEVTQLDRSREFKNYAIYAGAPHPNAPSFVKGTLSVKIQE